ncbi:unnamed protein product [Calypogeia fissa]
MASKTAALAVIRAARPVFRSAHDRVGFAIHASLLAAGYSLTAVGPAAASASSSASGSSEEKEVGIEGWNELEGAYAFQYSGGNHPGLCQTLIVKCTVMGDLLMVDASPLSGEDAPTHLEIKVTDYAVDGDKMGTNYAEQYKDLDGLVQLVNTILISKVAPRPPVIVDSSKSPPEVFGAVEPEIGVPEPRLRILEDPPRSSGFAYPEIPVYGGDDLMPGPGAGIFAPRRDIGVGGSMLVGPGDPRWGRVGVGQEPGMIPGGPIPPGVPPGARFDPFGPPGVPGFEPNRFVRDPRRPPGGHPDLEHFSPF